ncbi:serine/threonine protein kinase [Saccharomonospora piscinae]|uniref:serine/threonine-protein kinase n=1 Tax=Saccharomonospora piscinae TaxID=687388 RepID=UPI0011073BFA|nr:serine/threonine-protein kinase [Saccharomonospora piscinae]TLW93840.1 serine/threonine protein kinase [Saccharomonospora piscinae]
MSDEGRLVAGRYRVIRRIGTGAMGAVWQAHDEVLHRTVAIKQLLLQPGLEHHEAEDARQRTMREGRIAARLHHPNAITVFDVVTDDNGQPCLIMEYLPSISLAQELQRNVTLPPVEVARIGAQIASALKEAHAVGIVHRDIKPGNILLADNGVVKITDFGISRAKDDVTVTKTGMIAGTPAYLAPEVAVGGDPGPESDVFSLGSTLYAASEGQPPFGLSENTLGLLHAVAAGQINPPRQSGPLTSVLAVMLHPELPHRPTAQQCEDLLDSVARGETPLGGPSEGGSGTAVLGAAGAGAVGGVLGAAAAGHSGRLDGDSYDDGYDDGYGGYGDPYDDHDGYYYDDEPPTAQQPRIDDHDATAVAPSPTRAVPAAAAADYDDRYDDRYDDDYGDYGDYGDRDDERGRYEGPPPAEPADEQRGNWKIPAAIGVVVLAGMTVFVMWIAGAFTDGGDSQQPAEPDSSRSIEPPSTSDSSERSTTSTTEEVVETTEVEPVDPNPGGDVGNQPPPDESSEQTSTQSTTTTEQTTTSAETTSETEEPPSTTEDPPDEPPGGTGETSG